MYMSFNFKQQRTLSSDHRTIRYRWDCLMFLAYNSTTALCMNYANEQTHVLSMKFIANFYNRGF